MLCAILKKPDETAIPDVEVEFLGTQPPGLPNATVRWPKGRLPKGLERLANALWTRNHGHGYVRTSSGVIRRIEVIEFDDLSERVTGLFLAPPEKAVRTLNVMPKLEIGAYCKCGGGMAGSVRTKDKASVEKCIRIFRSVHSKPGCGPADAPTAARARRREEQKAAQA